ncbi:uncharacterized protein [Narcine bancroftii]|uniref:uncharacterized protein isoform X2 n=1 Tax=Narcine bancroftii TaxID=1343680 RepID=UPI003831F1D5
MELVFCLLVCHFLCTSGKHTNTNLHEQKNGMVSTCKNTKKVAISQSQWQVEINKTMHFLGLIVPKTSLKNTVCSKSIKVPLTRVRNHPFTTVKSNVCVFINSCTAENHVKLTNLILLFSTKHQSSSKDKLVTACRAAQGGLADNIVWIPSHIPMRGKYKTKQQNSSRIVTSSYKPIQSRHSLDNVTCLIRHPTIFTPLKLFVRCPFSIRIKNNSHGVKGRKNKIIFNTKDSEGIVQIEITGFVEQIDLHCSKQNSSLPEGIELVKNNLIFKGPMKESYSGTYVCVASNQHWKLSARWEIEITSDENHWFLTRAVLITLCVVFAGSVCLFLILRWHQRKQLVVTPKQYSIQNFGYQSTGEDCIKTRQDPGTTPADAPKKP